MKVKQLEGGYPDHAKFSQTFEAYKYLDEDYYKKEIQQLWHHTWIVAGHIDEIPNVGDYFTTEIDNESIIVIRGKDDTINAYYNVCKHRGSRLCETGENGNFAKGYLTCPYHSWMYDGSTGDLVSTPNIPEDEDFNKEDHGLTGVLVDVWDGIIFINLDEDAEPLKEALGAPESWVIYEQYGLENLKVGHQVNYEIDANWKFVMENTSECYHCSTIHPELNMVTPPSRPRHFVEDGIPETEMLKHAGGMDLRPQFERVNIDGKAHRTPFPGVTEEEMRKVNYVNFYPHCYMGLTCDYVFIAAIYPVSVEKTLVKAVWLFEEDVVENDGYMQDAIEFWDNTNRQDWKACELAHEGYTSKALNVGVLTPAEWRTRRFTEYIESKVKE